MSLRDTSPATLADTIAHAFDGWRQRIAHNRAWRAEYARTMRELSSYTEREFADLGIAAADVPDIARQQADRAVGRH